MPASRMSLSIFPVHQLETAVVLSEGMLAAARAGEWAKVTELEAERDRLLDSAFHAPVTGAQAGDVIALLETMVSLDGETLALAAVEREACGDQLREVQTGRKAHMAYARGSGVDAG